MIRKNRDKRGEILMDAIGSIDDRFIFEAQSASPKRSYAPLRKILALTFCTILVMSLTLSLFIGVLTQVGNTANPDAPNQENTGNVIEPDKENADGNGGDSTHEDFVKTDSILADTLIEMKGETLRYSSPLERKMLFDGSTHLIWRYEGEDDYRICKIGTVDSSKIKNALENKNDFKTASSDADHGELAGFWICFGDGLVYTPYLKNSSGNIGYGQLFDYDPELETSERFKNLIKTAIQNAN